MGPCIPCTFDLTHSFIANLKYVTESGNNIVITFGTHWQQQFPSQVMAQGGGL